MAEHGVEGGTNPLDGLTVHLLQLEHELLIGGLDIGTERNGVDCGQMLHVGKEIGGLLEDARNLVVGMQATVVYETWPEELGVLDIALIAAQTVVVLHHVGDGCRLGHLGYKVGVVDKILEVVSPTAEEGGGAQLIEELAGGIILAVEQGAAGHILQQLGAPTVLHAIFHTDAVAIVSQTEVVVHQLAYYMIGIYGQRGGIRGRALGEVIHIVDLTAKAAQGEVVHDDDGACGLGALTCALLDDTHPVEALDAVLHAQLVVEVGIAIPEVGGEADAKACKGVEGKAQLAVKALGQRDAPTEHHGYEEEQQLEVGDEVTLYIDPNTGSPAIPESYFSAIAQCVIAAVMILIGRKGIVGYKAEFFDRYKVAFIITCVASGIVLGYAIYEEFIFVGGGFMPGMEELGRFIFLCLLMIVALMVEIIAWIVSAVKQKKEVTLDE